MHGTAAVLYLCRLSRAASRAPTERRLELAFEGDRWADLVRTGRAATVMGIDPAMTLWPIPQNERDVAPGLTQNPGY